MNALRIKDISGKIIFAAVILLFETFSVNAQLVQLNLSFKKDTIQIGERTELQLEIINLQQVKLQHFPLTDSLDKEIEIIDSIRNQRTDTLSLNLLITSFKPGQYKIPGIPVGFSYKNYLDTIFSPEIVLTVLSPLIDSKADIKDIKPPLNLPFRLREIIPETGIVIAILLVIVAFTLFIIRRMRKKNIFEAAEKALPPHIIALRELDKLKEEKLWQNGKTKEYYSRLSDTMRTYLEKRFYIPAMEFVSSETLQAFQKSMPHEETLFEMLEGILHTADMVKFAKADPLPSDNQGNMDNAYLFIGQTKIEEILVNDIKADEVEKQNDIENKIEK
jgi:hypothetical protein